MERIPKIGARVRLLPSANIRCLFGQAEVTGTVVKVYAKKLYDDTDFDWDGPGMPPSIGPAPERTWSAAVKVDVLPPHWPYPNTDVFCPTVGELELLKVSK